MPPSPLRSVPPYCQALAAKEFVTIRLSFGVGAAVLSRNPRPTSLRVWTRASTAREFNLLGPLVAASV
jgi:hypothetical protein